MVVSQPEPDPYVTAPDAGPANAETPPFEMAIVWLVGLPPLAVAVNVNADDASTICAGGADATTNVTDTVCGELLAFASVTGKDAVYVPAAKPDTDNPTVSV